MTTFGEALRQARQLFEQGQLPQAEFIYRRLIEAAPEAYEPWHELGLVQMQAGQPELAVPSLRQAIAIAPNVATFHVNLGAAHHMLRQPLEAITSFEQALRLGQPTAELWNNLALARKDAGRRTEALAAFDSAVALRPDYANGHFNRGNLLVEMGRLAEAVESYRLSLKLRPDDAGANCKLGMAHSELGQMDEALAAFDRALAIKPDYPEARRNRGLIWLSQGRYAEGWPEAEWRLECADSGKYHFAEPKWDGGPLSGRTLLLYSEQGLGDTLQFVRYVPLVEKRGGEVLLQVQEPLRPLLEQSGFGRWLVKPGVPLTFDVQCPLMSLPGLIEELQGEPYWDGPYLATDATRVAQWQARLREINGFKIGLVWAGNPDHPHDRYRSVPLKHFLPLGEIPGVRLISLQKGPARQQLKELAARANIEDLADELDVTGGAFLDTAAVIGQLDLVVAVDTSTAHLAGALGAPIWVPLQISPDWRWLLHDRATPWYPSMRLFRQREFDRWPPVFAEIITALRPWVATKSR